MGGGLVLGAHVITEGYPESLPKSLEDRNVKLQAGRGDDPDLLEDANIGDAMGVVVLASDPFATRFTYDDSLTFDIVHRVRHVGYQGKLVAEVIDSRNRQRMLDAGATAVVLTVRAFPGLLSRALFHPGMEKVIESLFDSQGNECVSIPVDVDGEAWADVIQQYVAKSTGTPIAYAYQGEVVTEPNLKTIVTADTLYLLTER
jgi:voltage-gated potassium channel